jgi:hypothetical protein
MISGFRGRPSLALQAPSEPSCNNAKPKGKTYQQSESFLKLPKEGDSPG